MEKLLGLGLIATAAYCFFYFAHSRQRALMDSTAHDVVRLLSRCQELASSSQSSAGQGLVKVIFRPRGGAYQSLTITVDGQVADQREFEPGIFLVNTNGLVVSDELWIREDGALVKDASGTPRDQPDPGYLTVAGENVAELRLIEVRPAVGSFLLR
ncbi:MAG: hypothetical protein HY319_16460 [Armatimonadetes bacterium]|nr:hypothetical protein [Armatimonadota bacterium]